MLHPIVARAVPRGGEPASAGVCGGAHASSAWGLRRCRGADGAAQPDVSVEICPKERRIARIASHQNGRAPRAPLGYSRAQCLLHDDGGSSNAMEVLSAKREEGMR